MEHTYEKILGKPIDYGICTACGNINWYENETCHICDMSLSDVVVMTNKEMNKFINKEKDFYVEEEGYDEDEFWQIKLDV